MNWWNEIRKTRSQKITLRVEWTDATIQQIRALTRAFRLAQALRWSEHQHMARVRSGYDPHMN